MREIVLAQVAKFFEDLGLLFSFPFLQTLWVLVVAARRLGLVSQFLSIGCHVVPGAEQQFGKEVVTK